MESALARPKNLLAFSSRTPSLPRLAAAYACGIAANHPFLDANKRTSLVVALTFLELNGIEIEAPEEEVYSTFVGVADGSISERALSRWLESCAVRR